MQKGTFITVEGSDGSGKSTQALLLTEYLEDNGYETVLYREPGGTFVGEKIRSILLDTENKEMSALTEMFLYSASRAQLVEQLIKPMLQKGKVVICDRFLDSSLAYQGEGRGLTIETVLAVNRIAVGGLFPNLTLFYDLPPHISMKRRIETTGMDMVDRIEKELPEFHRKVYEGYKKIAAIFSGRIITIDASGSKEEVFEATKGIAKDFIKSHRMAP